MAGVGAGSPGRKWRGRDRLVRSRGARGWASLVEQTLAGRVALLALAGFFALRFFLTMLSYGSGARAASSRRSWCWDRSSVSRSGSSRSAFLPHAVEHPETFAVVGMAAYFSAIVRAPLTAIVLVVEMTGNYSLVLPLLAACLTAYGVADFLRDRPVYEALLERDLLRSQERPALQGRCSWNSPSRRALRSMASGCAISGCHRAVSW